MLATVTVENFRSFERLELGGLKRLNLLVGTNNVGKTSVLEAIRFLVSPGAPDALLDGLVRRREVRVRPGSLPSGTTFDAALLFRDRDPQKKVRISSGDATWAECRLDPVGEVGRQMTLFRSLAADEELTSVLSMRWPQAGADVPAYDDGALPLDVLYRRRIRRATVAEPAPFLAATGVSVDDVGLLLGSIALTEEYDHVVTALQALDGRIRGVSHVALGEDSRSGSVIVRLDDTAPVPIGNLGDGIWRLLGLALSLARARGGVLLIDEIDTGLHYSILPKMWQMVARAATRLDVQVFATTHSRDAFETMTSLGPDADISVQRIERGQPKATAFDARELRLAAENGFEVRG